MEYRKKAEGKLESGKSYMLFSVHDRATKEPISVQKWAELMAKSPHAADFAKDITKIIQGAPYAGVFFETKGVRPTNAGSKPFEFFLIESSSLASFAERRASSTSFQEHLSSGNDEYAAQFQNLGGNATLIAPKKVNFCLDDTAYSHLAAFVRGVPEPHVLHIWKKVATTYCDILETRAPNKPVWLSTAGQGVPWLHFRFDDYPKYYNSPFAREK